MERVYDLPCLQIESVRHDSTICLRNPVLPNLRYGDVFDTVMYVPGVQEGPAVPNLRFGTTGSPGMGYQPWPSFRFGPNPSSRVSSLRLKEELGNVSLKKASV